MACARIRRRIRCIVERLEQAHGSRRWSRRGRRPGLEGLIRTILSQHTNDANSGAAFDALVERFGGDWEAVRRAPRRSVARAIRVAGLSNVKAARIKQILGAIRAERGELSLEFLAGLPPEEAAAYLGRFEGVGPKTVACVLMFSFGMPVLPVDTHVHRLARRLGLIEAGVDAAAAHALLGRVVPAELVYPFHVLLIAHGREICHSRSPDCRRCVLRRMCQKPKIR